MLAKLPLPLALLLLLVAENVAAAPKSSASVAMGLKSRAPAARSAEELSSWAKAHRERMTTKYGGNISKTSDVDKRAAGTNLLINQNADSSYFGTIAIGTPPVPYNVILDTGSADLWIADSKCQVNCEGIDTFAASDSSSYVNSSTEFQITYGSGAASGNLGTDTVQLAGFSVQSQTFATCDDVSQGLLNEPVSGLMGLAFGTIAASGATPFWETLVTSGAWDEPLMAFQLTRFSNASGVQVEEVGGSFTMGATDPSLYTGEIDYNDVPNGQETYWLQALSSLTVQGTEITLDSSDSASYAAIDTGTTLIGGPADQIAQIYAQIPDSQSGGSAYEGYYLYPCDTNVEVTVSFGGQTWTISNDDFRVQQVSNSLCMGAFFEISTGGSAPGWIFGDTFLKNVYTVFRYEPASIGFAQLSDAARAMNGDTNAELPTATTGSASTIVEATSSVRDTDGAFSLAGSSLSSMTLLAVLVGFATSLWI